ncbi:uncharacterized protein LOC121645957 [Melanotaenia boesemani]|uniref:uncharacterized protein LOC121645957 n=1 Tax=Melanotaenia boesemani TaxID=1250792 RepID=UPI001C03DFE2|nr:uncharacterized protein LOC121645957 [Melanotaenia boesemani]XP_041850701.1 uncharacterized protein LOC121645957 [Melanotaenia boesemani]XP_041850702.1 uncharacterized protein LOC121645957 [Melanotaenia boesemani]
MEDDEKQTMARRIKELEKELSDLRTEEAPSTSGGAMGQNPGVMARADSVVYVQQDRKLPTFSGKLDSTDSLTLDEWIDQMRSFVQTRGRTEREQAQMVFDHLEGAARTEIKFLPPDHRENVQKIFDALTEVYGCHHSRILLQRKFFNRKQYEGESLVEYSHSLMDLMEQIMKTDNQAASKASKDLRDQFCEGVRNPALRMRLKDLVNANSQWTVREVRAEATRWMAQQESQPFGRRYDQSPSVSNEMQASCETMGSSFSEYAELTSLLKAQQTQLELVIKALTSNSLSTPSIRATRPRRTVDGQPVCFRCEKVGHIARFCPAVAASGKSKQGRGSEGSGSDAPRPAEN